MAGIERSAGAAGSTREVAPSAPVPEGSQDARRGAMHRFWDGMNEVVKSPVFVFFVGGSFIALLPRVEEWRLPPAEREARALEQQSRADAALIAPFLGNLNATEQGRFRASAAALKSLEDASRRAHEGRASPMFEGVNAAIEAVAKQLWPPPAPTAEEVEVKPVPAASPTLAGAPVNLAQTCVYIQVARKDTARRVLATTLKAELDAKSILAPGIQLMADQVVPQYTQVRYFNDDDRGNAAAMAAVVGGITNRDVGIARPALQAKPGTLEVWFGKE